MIQNSFLGKGSVFMVCKQCKSEVNEDFSFCPKCGMKLIKTSDTKKYDYLSICVIVASVLIVFILFAFPLINLNEIKHTPEMTYTTRYSDKEQHIREHDENIYFSKISFFDSADRSTHKENQCTAIETTMKIIVLLMSGICLTCILLAVSKKTKFLEILFSSNIAILLFFILLSNIIWSEKEINPRNYYFIACFRNSFLV